MLQNTRCLPSFVEKAKDPAGWNEHIREYLDLGDRESCPVIMMSELQYDGRFRSPKVGQPLITYLSVSMDGCSANLSGND